MEIATGGAAPDFGNLSEARGNIGCGTNGHGGLNNGI